jgi:hypothetical protein
MVGGSVVLASLACYLLYRFGYRLCTVLEGEGEEEEFGSG